MKLSSLLILALTVSAPIAMAAAAADSLNEPHGMLPVGKDNKPLNFDFEDGTLRDWTAEGEPFSRRQLTEMLDLAERGIGQLVAAQKAALGNNM